jgi:hypothetical protein
MDKIVFIGIRTCNRRCVSGRHYRCDSNGDLVIQIWDITDLWTDDQLIVYTQYFIMQSLIESFKSESFEINYYLNVTGQKGRYSLPKLSSSILSNSQTQPHTLTGCIWQFKSMSVVDFQRSKTFQNVVNWV